MKSDPPRKYRLSFSFTLFIWVLFPQTVFSDPIVRTAHLKAVTFFNSRVTLVTPSLTPVHVISSQCGPIC
jgi:hypothetical protein